MPTVLIVDDSPVNRSLLRKLLETEGYEVIGEAANGKEGYEEFVKHSPDIVTLDVSMPEMNGIEALKFMNSHNPKAKIIILSAESENEKKEDRNTVICNVAKHRNGPVGEVELLWMGEYTKFQSKAKEQFD